LHSERSASAADSKEVYQQDGDYIKDIEVNDLRNRYTLTKGSTQKMVNITCQNPLMSPDDVFSELCHTFTFQRFLFH